MSVDIFHYNEMFGNVMNASTMAKCTCIKCSANCYANAMAKCACVACNSCTCACSCRKIGDEIVDWDSF